MRITSSRCENRGSVGDYSLDILPIVLRSEGEASVRCLRIPLSNCAEGYHHSRPLLRLPDQPLLLLHSAPNEAVELALPSHVVHDEAKAFKGLAGSVLVLCIGLANVVGFAGLREVPLLRPELHKDPQRLMVRQLPCVIPSCKWMTRGGLHGSVQTRQRT